MLLFVCGYEMIEAEMHDCDVEQVCRFYGKRLAIFVGRFQGCVEHLIIINFQARHDATSEILLEESQASLELGWREQRLAGAPTQPGLSSSHMEHLDFVETGQQNGRRISLHDGLRSGRVGLLPVKLE